MDKSKFDVVKNSPIAVELNDQQIETLAKIVEIRKLQDGEFLIEEGKIDNALHVVIGGEIAVVKRSGVDEEQILHLHRSGELAGAMGFVDGLEHSATLRSFGESQVYSFNRNDFEGLLKNDAEIVYKVMRSVVRNVHSIVRRMNDHYIQMTNYISKQSGRY